MPVTVVAIAEWLHFQTLRLVHAPQLRNNLRRHSVTNSSEYVLEPHQLRSVVAAQEIVRAALHFVEDIEILDYEPVAFQWRQRCEVFQTMLVQFDILPNHDAHEAQRPKISDQLLRKDIKSAPPRQAAAGR